MAGCKRGASDSGEKVESGEGKVKELAETTPSICSIDDCTMAERAFSSAKASRGVEWDIVDERRTFLWLRDLYCQY